MSRKKIAPRYLRRLKPGQYFFFKYKRAVLPYRDESYAFGFKHPQSGLLLKYEPGGTNTSFEVLSEFEISYFETCPNRIIRFEKNLAIEATQSEV